MKTETPLHKPTSAKAKTASSPLPSPPAEERENHFAIQAFQRAKSHLGTSQPGVTESRPLLLLSEDEVLCWNLLMAASRAGRRLIRGHPNADGPQMLRIVKPNVVLLDLDLPEEMAWVAA